MNYLSLNGKIVPASEPVLPADNRSYRYGDGLFETMKIVKGQIQLVGLHFERLFSGLSLLKYGVPQLFTTDRIREEILSIAKKNKCEELARIRLSVSRGQGGLYDEDRSLQYIIECWPLDREVSKLNENGLVIGLYDEARKNCDVFSNLKSASFLPYSLAALHAKENKWNDCLLLNIHDRICDTTIANIFWIKNAAIYTPSLSEGCINGVMRKHLFNELHNNGYNVKQTTATTDTIEEADEVFLTNAIKGIRWVKQFRNKIYGKSITEEIFNRCM